MALSMTVVAVLLIGIMATSVLAAKPTAANSASLAKNAAVSNQLWASAVSAEPLKVGPNEVSPGPVAAGNVEEAQVCEANRLQVSFDDLEAMDTDELKQRVPESYVDADARIIQRVRFLLYTHDGTHIMWGFVGNGYFVGQDNLGKSCWGIYGNGVFAGFYDGEFFWGKYRCGNWKAIGLFGENYSFGKYILFPTTSIRP